jgi:transcriptional regulator with XRE-family HTH domain
MAKPFSLLRDQMSPQRRARVEARVQEMIQDMALAELRAARDLTQEHLSSVLGVKQSAVSKLERRADMYVSTLRSFIKAMGGDLEIRAVFPDGAVRITQFQHLAQEERQPAVTAREPGEWAGAAVQVHTGVTDDEHTGRGRWAERCSHDAPR